MKRIRILPVILFALLLGLLAFGISTYLLKHKENGFVFTAQKNVTEDALKILTSIQNKEEINLFENTQKEYPSFDSKEAYDVAIQALFQDVNVEELNLELVEKTDTQTKFEIHNGEQYLGTLKLDTDENDTIHASLPIQGSESYIFEVPVGRTFTMNGLDVDASYKIEENVPASNFFQFQDQTSIPHVDIYEVDHLLGLPEVELDGEKGEVLVDAITQHLLVGEALEDEELKELMIEDGQKIAQYPAQEVGLGAVSEIALTSSSWYERYTSLQNYWFTAHNISNFSNQDVICGIKQSEDTAVGHVVFDYFADNGEVHRTWHIGYQMTMVNTPQGWKVAGMEINNELNPNQIQPE